MPLGESASLSASVSFSKLFTYFASNSAEHLPLSELERSDGHVHGHLEVRIGCRELPHMGFFGPHDVCFNTWIEELAEVVRQLTASESAIYVFDEGEQGQPAFEFRRRGDMLFVSVVESLLSGASADLKFQSVSCSWFDFHVEVQRFFTEFQQALLIAAPVSGEAWWERHGRRVA